MIKLIGKRVKSIVWKENTLKSETLYHSSSHQLELIL